MMTTTTPTTTDQTHETPSEYMQTFLPTDKCYNCPLHSAHFEYQEGRFWCETCFIKNYDDKPNMSYCLDCDELLTRDDYVNYIGKCEHCYAEQYGLNEPEQPEDEDDEELDDEDIEITRHLCENMNISTFIPEDEMTLLLSDDEFVKKCREIIDNYTCK